MTRYLAMICMVLFAVTLISTPVCAETATMAEARNIAANWIRLILHEEGSWGGSAAAELGESQELERDGRTIGYLCQVEPKGYIIVSLIKGLAPVKAYSATSNFCADSDEGLNDVIKYRMANLLTAVEERTSRTSFVGTQSLESVLEVNYLDQWADFLEAPQVFENRFSSVRTTENYTENDTESYPDNYVEGTWLLESSWHQGYPYNLHCPAPLEMGNPMCLRDHCSVGCTALAAGQIMKYWGWPPFGVGAPYDDPYDWANIPNTVDESSSWDEINATANLVREIGRAAETNYCNGETAEDACSSGAFHWVMTDAYEEKFVYSQHVVQRLRSDYTSDTWWAEIKQQISSNQPIQYGVPGHSLVCDGWKESGGLRQYHMNYGWNGGDTGDPCWDGIPNTNTWYSLDALPCSDLAQEDVIINIFPLVALGGAVSGMYSEHPTFKYLYFNVDCVGSNAIFGPGQGLQFLPGIVLTANPSVLFQGTDVNPSTLFSRGDITRGIVIHNGEVGLFSGGQIKFH